jgi:hypothetical protein
VNINLTSLFFKKMLVAFVVGFASTFGQFLVSLGPADYSHFSKSLWVSALVGAATAGLRALLALSPLNIVPSDAENSVVAVRKPAPPAA